MSKQIVMGCTAEELEAVGVANIGCDWSFYLIEYMKKKKGTDILDEMKRWEAEGAENIGNDLSRLTKKKEGGYVELDVVVKDGIYMVKGIKWDGEFKNSDYAYLSNCPNIVGFGGILFEGVNNYWNMLSYGGEYSNSKPRKPIKARFWREV